MRIRRNKQSPSSSSSTSSSSRSQRNGLRKKQKRLDAICEKEYTRNRVEIEENGAGSFESEAVRRSSRVRRAPAVLDISPPPPKRKRKNENGGGSVSSKAESVRSNEMAGGWKLRLRSTVHIGSVDLKEEFDSSRGKRNDFHEEEFREYSKGKGKGKVLGGDFEESKGVKSLRAKPKRNGSGNDRGASSIKTGEQEIGQSAGRCGNEEKLANGMVDKDNKEKNVMITADMSSTEIYEKAETKVMDGLHKDFGQSGSRDLETLVERDMEEGELKRKGGDMEEGESDKEGGDFMFRVEATEHASGELESGGAHAVNGASPVELGNKRLQGLDVELNKSKQFSTDMLDKRHVREGRRCGLCGRGTDGKLVHTDGDKEVYRRLSSCEEGNYDTLDGFGNEPGWLGRLLGPIHDRFGIADVWVHQHCAVWSPEVYFAGLGCLKNVRAALSRGKALKCSRCERPGATIGCRVDRCPKTYHLPCGRAAGCIFDHRKFLIACKDHRHLFEPYRNNNLQKIKKLEAKKLKLETRKQSHEAWRKDIEAEEKWLENCGEDEEFLKREGKRLNRDILRIAPVYIGGSSTENQHLYRGWESVAGLQDVIQCMKEVVILPLLYPEFFSNIGLTPPRGVLLHGYPGTGKTHVVRALIGSCSRGGRRIAYFARKGADCLGKYVGDAERQLRLLFQVAERSQPSIIFFDEIDGLAPCRTRQQDQTHNSVVSTLLALMDGLKSRGSVIVIGATNRPDAVDPALRRPGRFDREIYFPLPSVKDRAAILSLHTQSWPKPISGSLLNWIAQKTSGFAGADLQALCTQAAMIALKRSCPLQGLMLAAEEEASNGRHLPLPFCLVEETDWLDALSCAPPPCSLREAGMAANDVVSSPLFGHLLPCLLQPLTYLLVSLYIDERVWLPPLLCKAADLVKIVIISTLNGRDKSSDLWWSYLPDLVKEADVAKEIEKALFCAGFLISGSSFTNRNSSHDANDAGEEFELGDFSSAGADARSRLWQNVSDSGRKPGFRVLLTGHPKSGQRHIASSLLHGFVGCVEIQKVDLATISQEGHGDVVEGMTNILLKCSSKGNGIIYMPRIDLWAMEMQHEVNEKEESCANICESPVAGVYDAKRTVSRVWNCFIEQVDSICTSTSLMILATSEVPSEELPHRISQFFSSNTLSENGSSSLEHTMPRFIVQVGGSFDYDMVINSSAAQLSRDLVQQYVQLLHHRAHAAVTHDTTKAGDAIIGNAEVSKDYSLTGAANDRTDNVISPTLVSNEVGPCDGNRTEQHFNSDDQRPTLSSFSGQKEAEIKMCHTKDTVPRVICSNKTVKGKSNLVLAISSFGYQILRYPHFAELCWTTSKLKDGPYADINGPCKDWPFNSCIIRPGTSLEKTSLGRNTNDLKHKESFGVVRGLIAVGLLAYRGVYTSIREVSFDVRKVLELLVGQLNAKILSGKDKSHFLYLLSQVAYLDDMVNSWAYTLQSLECDNSVPAANSGVKVARNPEGCHASEHTVVGSDVSKPNNSQKTSDQLKVLEQSEFIVSDKVLKCPDLPCHKAKIATPEEALQEMASLTQHSYGSLLQTSSSTVDVVACDSSLVTRSNVNNIEPENGKSGGELCGSFRTSEKSNDLGMERSMRVNEDGGCSHNEKSVMNSCGGKISNKYRGLSKEKVVPSPNDYAKSGHVDNLNITLAQNTGVSLPSLSKLTCLYSCCGDCLDSICALIQKILIHEWKTIGNSWTVEDVHDAVCSWSANLLSAVRKLYSVESVRMSELISKDSVLEPDISSCTCSYVDHRQPNGKPHHISSGNSVVAPVECSFHSKSRDVEKTTNASTNSQCGVELKFVFKDNVLISSDLDKDVLFHCKFQNVCLNSLLEWILMIKQPLN